MANILEFLRVLLSDGEQQRRFAADPHGYLKAHEFEHLSGEDVAEAIPVLLRSLAGPITERLEPYASDEGDALPPVRPLVGESDLDAAVRQLTFATSLTGLTVVAPETGDGMSENGPVDAPATADTAQGEDVVEMAGTVDFPELALSGDADVADVAEVVEVADVAEDEPAPAAALSGSGERAAPEPVMAVDADGRIDPFAAFGDEIAAVVRFATHQMEELTRKASDRHDALIGAAEREAEAVRAQADEEANSLRFTATEEAHAIRSAAQSDAQNLRSTAQAEADAVLQAAKSAREEARIFKQAAKDDANAILQSARSTQEEAQRQATDLLKNAEREASAMLAEARARRDEIREAERQLRKRLQGVESVFRTLQEGDPLPEDEDKAVPRT